MTDDVPASQRWRGRPVHSLLLQAFVFAIPVIASVAAATAVSAVGPRPDSLFELVGWWGVLTVIALGALALVDRLARKLLPLATLLKLSMVFPDRAPSRFRMARNAASVRKLQEQLALAREQGMDAEPIWAAETILTLITALGHHDRRSRGHSERVHVYAELLAEELDLDQADRDRLRWAALLHDVGKLVVPAELLNKPGSPDEKEWDALRQHPKAGAELCAPLLPWLGEWGAAIAEHHEWYDGTGYPQGLSGLQISRAARIVAVADCYEVMTTSRTYKRALNPAAARKELALCAGTQFDPAIVRAFLNISLGKLRLAMGPLAMLSTVPSMARLAGLFEPLAPIARAGAVVGGAALVVGGGVLPTPAIHGDRAEATELDHQIENAVLATDDGADELPGGSGEPLAAGRGMTVVAAQARREEVQSRRAGSRDDGAGASARTAASRMSETKSASKSDRPVRTGRPATAGVTVEDLGANPVPPTAPPGQEPTRPDGPPANPTPPRNDKAAGKGF